MCALFLPSISVVTASAADVGHRDFSYRDGNNVQVPTDDKAQSKLWFQDGSWWGLLYDPVVHATCIYRLDAATQSWVSTGTVVDDRPTARADVLWDGTKLYVVSGTTVVSEYSLPPNPGDVAAGSARLLRFSYDPGTKSYSLDQGFPVKVHDGSTESITLAKDSLGGLWVTYTQVASDNTSQVYVVHAPPGDPAWGSPFVIPTTASGVHYDDISAIVAFQGDKIGVMWSNQLTRKFYLAVHRDGQPDGSWATEIAYGGGVAGCSTGCANDHVNIKQLTSDGSGRVFAAVKTANRNTGQAFVVLLARDSRASWSSYQFGAVEDVHTRPMVMVDEEHRQLIMLAVSPEVGGTVYYKKTPLDKIAFAPGLGTPFIQSDTDTDISSPTSTKQNLNSATGLVVLASANANGNYWHNYLSLAEDPAPPPAAPTNLTLSSPTTGLDSSLALNWSDNSTNEAGFAIDRKTGTAAYAQVGTTAAGAVAYTDTNLAAGTTYTYRVRAFNDVGGSLYSNEASGTTTQTGPVRTFTSLADSYVDGGLVGTNFGTKMVLSVDGSPVQESYLKFQLSGLTGNTVTSAKLRLYVSDNGSVKGGSVAKMSNTSWTETGVTYNNRPAIDGAVLSTLGAVAIGSWYEFDVKAAVTGDSLLGLGVKTSSSDGVHYSSREDVGHAPQLVVTVAPGDTTPPDTTMDSGPTGTVATSTAAFSFSSTEAGSSFECSLDSSAYAACISPKSYTGLAEGPHTINVRAVDAVGNIDTTPATRAWTVDTAAPATVISSGPPALSSTSDASITFSADEAGATFGCSLDNSAFTSCTSPRNFTGLADGEHTFRVRATDPAGNTEATPPSVIWTVDTVAPDTTIDTGPQGTTTIDSADFTFTSSETGAAFTCSLDAAPSTVCTSPVHYAGLSDGSHAFTVRATDAAGNPDATPANRSWTVDTAVYDTSPPMVAISTPTADDLVRGDVTIDADAVDDVGLDHVDFWVGGAPVGTDATAPYTATWNSTLVPDGDVILTARAVDTSTNETTSTPVKVTVDNTAPETAIESGPQGFVANNSAQFAFSSQDSTASFQCNLDGSSFSACTSPQQYSGLGDGTHTFEVRAKDTAGNLDTTPASRAWTVDATAPDTTITSGPTGTVVSRSAGFSFSATETAATFECSLDGSAYVPCTSPNQFGAMADGAHTFAVRARDVAGNLDATPATRTWTVDPVAFTDGFESGNFAKWSVHSANNGVAAIQSKVVRTGSYAASFVSPSTSSYTYARATLASAQNDLSVSGDFDVTVEGAAGQDVPIFKLYDSSSVRVVYVYRRNVSGRIYVVWGGTTYLSTAKLSLGTWAQFRVRTIIAGNGASTVDLTMAGVSIYRTTAASLGTAGLRTIQIGNDKQLPFALYADNIEAWI